MNKNILMIGATPFFSDRGCHVRIYNEMKYLKKNGFNVTLATYHLGDDIEGISIQRTPYLSWYTKTTPGASWQKLYLDVLLLFVSIKTYFSLRPKVIHAHLYEGLLIAFVVKIVSVFQVKIIFDCQGSLASEMQNYTLKKKKWYMIFYPFFVALEKILLFFPDKILCSSQNSCEILTQKYSVPKQKIDILEDGIDEELFQKVSKNEKRLELNIPESATVITYTGGISNGKGIAEFLAYSREFLTQRDDVVILVGGYGDLLDGLKSEYSNLVTQKRIIFTGRVSYFELPEYIAISDFCIDPKEGSSESSGKIYNYIAAGKKVIAFENTFTKNILGESGYFISDFSEIPSVLKKEIPQNRDIQSMLWSHIIQKYLLIIASYDS